jgi:hypothetical protein
MKRIWIAGACVVAALAVAVLGTASASAQPIYRVCAKLAKIEGKYHGHYTNKNCTTPATAEEEAEGKKNEYEFGAWNEGKEAEPKFTFKSGTFTLTSYIKGFGIVGAITAAKSSGEGHITGPSTGTEVITLEKMTTSGESCGSAGEPAGTVKTEVLDTELVEIPETKGVVVRVEGAPTFAEFSCGSLKWIQTGAIDGVVTGDVGVVSKDSTETFSVNAGGEQINTVDGDVLLTEVVGTGIFESGVNTTAGPKGEEMEIEP